MKLHVACATMIALVASPYCQASGCSLPERGPVLASLTSVAAPEMMATTPVEAACLSAQQLVDLTPTPTAAPAPALVNGSTYVPKTKDDNTPWRFDMNQNGKRMTAEQFDAWMKAKGIHVASGKPTAVAAPESGSCQPSDTVTC
jgi:hypothetical protein